MTVHNYYHRALHGAPVLRAARVGDRRAVRIPATRPQTSKSIETRKETCNQRVKRQNFLPPHILFIRVVARTTVSLRAFKVMHGHQKFGALQEEILIFIRKVLLSEKVITPNGIDLYIILLCISFIMMYSKICKLTKYRIKEDNFV